MKYLKTRSTILISLLVAGYFFSHLWGVTKLPVFADEAIYIRWSQLIIDDWQQYLFFPLNDGKTPLFVWQLLPALLSFKDPLFAARFVSVLGGVVQVIALVMITKELRGKRIAQVIVALLGIVLPFWFFHHRMALMDGWLSAWLSLSILGFLKALKQDSYKWSILAGVSLGAAFLTKIPAVLIIPSLVVISAYWFWQHKHLVSIFKHLAVVGAVGVGLFATLKVSPAFPQLFFRGSDFLFPVGEVLKGKWTETVQNFPTYGRYFWQYLSFPVILVSLWGLATKRRPTLLLLWMCFFSFVLPIAVLGKVVYPRYLLPGAIFLTVAAALSFEEVILSKKKTHSLLGSIMLLISIVISVGFIVPSLWNPNRIPFVETDKVQYLTEWSSGHGIKEIYLQLMAASKTEKIAVATEGFFGTLPDGLLLYLHRQDVSNLRVDGVGQPIHSVPESLFKLAGEYDKQWLVVNSHRRLFELPSKYLLASCCRPYNGPCLELWDVTEYIDEQSASRGTQ